MCSINIKLSFLMIAVTFALFISGCSRNFENSPTSASSNGLLLKV